jgi:tetratricopeptide (TPR) repeat protein
VRERIAALIDGNQFERAKQELGPALAAEPDSRYLLYLLSLAEHGSGDYEAALAAVDRVLGGGYVTAVALLHKARVLSMLNRNLEAVEQLEQALTLEPDNVSVHILLARLLADGRREFDRALSHARQACALDPSSARAHLAVGIVLRSHGGWRRTGEAREPLRIAAGLDPGNLDVRNTLALVDLRRRRTAAAIRGFADILAASPQSESAAANLPLAVWIYLVRQGLCGVGLAVLAAFGASIVSGPTPWPAWLGHTVAAVVVAALTWLLLLRPLTRVFPVAMRPAAKLLLRRDMLIRPVLLGGGWLVLCCLVLVGVPWWDLQLIGVVAVAAFVGYYWGLAVSRVRLRELTSTAETERQRAWAAAAVREPARWKAAPGGPDSFARS